MRKIARTALALAIALGFLSLATSYLYYSRPLPPDVKPIPLSKTFLFTFFTTALYGWLGYLPFVLLHAYVLKRYPAGQWLASTLIGGLLAGTTAVLLTSSFTPAAIVLNKIADSQLLTGGLLGLTGGLYGLLYHRWVAVKA